MDENKIAPESNEAVPTPEATPVETPSTPVTPPVAPEPAQAGYEAQYAAQPAPTAQPVPGVPVPTAPVSPTPALVCGILSIVFSWIPIVGIILGIVAIVMAGKYIKAGGTDGTAKGGRICGIVGIVFSVITIIASCVLVVFTLNELQNYQTTASSLSSSYESQSSSSSTVATDEDEEAVFAAVNPYLDQIKNQDPQMVATIASMIEVEFNDALEDTGITLADCGVDPQQMALAMIKGFDYEQSYVTVDGDLAEANYEVTVRSNHDVSEAIYDKMMDLLSEVSDGTMTQEEAYLAIGQGIMSAIQSVEPEEGNIWDVEASSVTGSWIMDSESWDDELEYFFVLS